MVYYKRILSIEYQQRQLGQGRWKYHVEDRDVETKNQKDYFSFMKVNKFLMNLQDPNAIQLYELLEKWASGYWWFEMNKIRQESVKIYPKFGIKF